MSHDRRHLLPIGMLVAFACTRSPYTGRFQTMTIDEGEALARADRAAEQYRRTIRPVTDPATVERVDRVAARVLDAAKSGPAADRVARLHWEFVVVGGADTTVAVLENGTIFLGAALVRLAATDDELAGPIGHAIVEVVLRHASERARPRLAPQVGPSPSVGSDTSRTRLEATQAEEADWIGLVLATRAGYDPSGTVRMLERLGENARAARLRARLPELRAEHSATTRQ